MYRERYAQEKIELSAKSYDTFSDVQKLTLLLECENRVKACRYRDDSSHSALLSAIALMYHKESDDVKAIQYYRQAIALVSGRTGAVPAKDLVEYYCNLSDAYESLNKVAERLASLDSAIAIGMRSPPISRLFLWCIYARVVYYYDVGDYRRCMNMQLSCEKFGKQYASSPAERTVPGGRLLYADASIQWNVNALIELRRFDDAESTDVNRIRNIETLPINNFLGILFEQLAEIFAHNKTYDKALSYFREAYDWDTRSRQLNHVSDYIE